MNDRIAAFYGHQAPDDRGRTLREIWTWDHHRLEVVHDYIQWLFPLREPSRFNYLAPLVTDETVAAFANQTVLRDALQQSFDLMLDFYGLERREDGGVRIEEAESFAHRSRNWVTQFNHNHLRLTRILMSSRLLGLPSHSEALFDRLAIVARQNPGSISLETLGYWQQAAHF
jgi:hypothetical protein